MIVRSIRPLVRPRSLVNPARFLSAHPEDPVANLISVLKSADDLYAKEPKPANDIFAAFIIAKAVRSTNPLLAEYFNAVSYRAADEIGSEFVKQLRLSEDVDEIATVKSDEKGKYLNIRNGLVSIRLSSESDDQLIITSPANRPEIYPLAYFLASRHESVGPVRSIIHQLLQVAENIHFGEHRPIPKFPDYGLILRSNRFTALKMSKNDYFNLANLNERQIARLNAKLEELN